MARREPDQPEQTVTNTGDGEPASAVDDRAGGEPTGTAERYQRRVEHARGGLGRIWRAYDRQLEREVAIKELLAPGHTAEARFQREVLITSRLEHPGIVPVYDSGRWSDGRRFYAMKLVTGRSLKQVIAEAETTELRVALLSHVIAVADAIGYAHSKGILHRDLKPSNVLVGEFGETVVVDWGLAKDVTRDDPGALPAGPYRTAAGAADVTVAGSVLGTPAYMAPEQADGDEVDRSADIYSLGAILFHVLTGRPPYRGETSDDVLDQLRSSASPPRLRDIDPSIPHELAAAAERALARDPGDRYPTATAFADDLRRYQAGQLVTAYRYSPLERIAKWTRRHKVVTAAVAAALVVAIAGGAFAFTRERSLRQQALRERDRAAAARERAEAQSLALLEAQGHAELDDGRAFRAAALFHEAYQRGRSTLSLRIGLGQAMETVDSRQRSFPAGSGDAIRYARFGPAGDAIVTGGTDGSIRLWDAATGELTRAIDVGASNWPGGFSPSGDRIVGTLEGDSVGVWDVATGERVLRIEASCHLAVFSPDGETIASGCDDGTVRLWRATTGRELARLRGHEAAVPSIAFSPDGTRLVSVAVDQTARVWDVASRRSLATIRGGYSSTLRVAISPDGTRVATGGAFGSALWNAESGERIAQLDDHGGNVMAVAFSPDGGVVVTGSDGNVGGTGRAVYWDAATGRRLASLPVHARRVHDLALSPDGQRLLTLNSDSVVHLWDADRGRAGALYGHTDETFGAVVAGSDRLITWDHRALQGWDASTGRRVWRRPADRWYSWSGAATDRHLFLRMDCDGQPCVAKLRTRDGTVEDELVHQRVSAVAVSPDGGLLATASADRLQLWDTDGGAERAAAPVGAAIAALAFRPDGRALVAASDDGAVTVWTVDPLRPHHQFRAHDDAHAAVYSPDGARILTTGQRDDVAKLWDAATGELALALKLTARKKYPRVGFSPDGRLAVAIGWNHAAFWDLDREALVHVLTGPQYGPGFTPDGRSVVFGGNDGYAQLFHIERRSPKQIGAILRDKAGFVYTDLELLQGAGGDAPAHR